MVESTPSKDQFLVEHTDFSLREKIKYPNGLFLRQALFDNAEIRSPISSGE